MPDEIRFIFEAYPPFGDIEVISDLDGRGLLLVCVQSGEELVVDDLASSDQSSLRRFLKQEIENARIAREPHVFEELPKGDVGLIRSLNQGER